GVGKCPSVIRGGNFIVRTDMSQRPIAVDDLRVLNGLTLARRFAHARITAMTTPTRKLRWGILGTAKIARLKVIPALQRSARCEVVAIASRSLERARTVAASLGIPRSYGSYAELLADPE